VFVEELIGDILVASATNSPMSRSSYIIW